MNIVNKLTLRLLRKNKRRTLVTIIGVIISVAMLTGVSSIGTSFIDLLQRQIVANEGDWHVLYEDVTPDQIDSITKDDQTKEVSLTDDLGYASLEKATNENKPYLFIKQYNEKSFQHMPITVTDGRLPENEHELVVSNHIESNGGVAYDIGDELSLDIGNRVADDEEMPYSLGQSTSLQWDDDSDIQEKLEPTIKKDYTIVGIIERPEWEPVQAPGYTVLTYLDENQLAAGDTVNASVTLNKVSNAIQEDTQVFAEKHGIDSYQFHDSLLRYQGVISNDGIRSTLYLLSAILFGIIIVGSVSLIYNAFAISVTDRSKYLGMLSSVGATRKQKRNSVFFEGLIISLISIPLGILAGLGGIAITFIFINSLIQDTFGLTEKIQLTVTPGMIGVAMFVSLLTVFISTYLPAKRASNVTAIDAIREAQDVKLTEKKVKTSKLVRKLFGLEAEIGLKNLKRNKRRYQATVFSIVISIVLFLSVTYFTDNLKKSIEMTQDGLNSDISVTLGYDDDDHFIEKIQDLPEVTDTNVMAENTEFKINILNEKIPSEVREEVCFEDEQCPYFVNMYVLNDDELKAYAEQTDVDYKMLENKPSAIVIDRLTYVDYETKKRVETKSVNTKVGEEFDLLHYDWEADSESYVDELIVAGTSSELPQGMREPYLGNLHVIVSENTIETLGKGALLDISFEKSIYINSEDPLKTQEDIERIEELKHSIYNFHQERQAEQQLVLLISVFVYGFIALITAISVANILNTISTSISLRTREFAMLKSVGMTPKGFNKMINYESIFYGIKALLYGLPISFGIMLLMHRAFSEGFSFGFTIPWLSVLYVIIAVFAIVGISMLYSSSKVKKENIIDALKQENF